MKEKQTCTLINTNFCLFNISVCGIEVAHAGLAENIASDDRRLVFKIGTFVSPLLFYIVLQYCVIFISNEYYVIIIHSVQAEFHFLCPQMCLIVQIM